MTEEKQRNTISIDTQKSAFGNFLKQEGNKRIFFSGKFGVGKTFFLQKFFEGEQEGMDVYHLFPIRYQISSNENIIELLKYDILVELLKKHPDAFKVSKTNTSKSKGISKSFSTSCKDKGLDDSLKYVAKVVGGAFSLSPEPSLQVLGKLGRSLDDIVEFCKKYKEFRNGYVLEVEEINKKFIKETFAKDVSQATDYISQILLEKIKQLNEEKKSVLILDDFDRMDPEHIFRIFNILSAHMEDYEENKFGFDHIIIVGDIDNIKSIFHHKYGKDTNFEGYIDKFFTIKPYIFNNNEAIEMAILPLLRSIKYRSRGSGIQTITVREEEIVYFLNEVFSNTMLTGGENMNLRQFYKIVEYQIPEITKFIFYPSHSDIAHRWRVSLDTGIKLLVAYYGNEKKFLEVLAKISKGIPLEESQGHKEEFCTDNTQLMLRRMLKKIKVTEGYKWLDKYPLIERTDGPTSYYSLDGNEEMHEKCFYDSLIEYVKRYE